MIKVVIKYFPLLSETQIQQLSVLKDIYINWNNMINVISRKDIDNFYIHHVLHSLSIAKIIPFAPQTRILDVGTGGGFPGIPLAIMFPDSEFTLLDSIEKKIKVVSAVAEELQLKNVIPLRKRAEDENKKYHFIISRAVTEFSRLVTITEKNIARAEKKKMKSGIISLKGGDLSDELKDFKNIATIWNIKEFFTEPFFETKKIIYLPI